MSKVYFISDLHFGHKDICTHTGPFRGNCTTMEESHQFVIQGWNSVVKKQDLVFVLGDVCFDKKYIHLIKSLNGSKHLILGNHDTLPLKEYLKYFNKVHGFMKYKGAWLSHAPIHSGSLRGKFNIHGHVHQNSLDDLRYINVSVEVLKGRPIPFEDLQDIMQDRKCVIQLNALAKESE